jgi:tRNA A-37 threonylcarbamoyl transferase component Bud32
MSAEIKEIGGFELIGKIGAGGMGTVFKARQKSLDRIVALKILPPSIAKDQTFIERFLREARTSAKLNHPNIVQGIDVGHDPKANLYYFAMEFVDGPSLKGVQKKEHVIPEKRALEITHQVAAALECAQRAGIVHRDIKPDNILLTTNGNVKLADLGLARQQGANDAGITLGGSTLGTPFYMSPEQVRGELAKVDVRSDIYSLGATLFHLVTGQPPYSGATSALIMSKHLTEAPPKPRELKPELSEACSKLILKMLEKDQRKRQQSATELSAEIELILQGEVVAGQPPAPRNKTGKHEPVAARSTTGRHRPVGGSDPKVPSVRRHRQQAKPALLGVGVLAVVVVVGIVALSAGGGSSKPQAPAKPVAAPAIDETRTVNTASAAKPADTPRANPRIAQAAEALEKALKANEGEGQDVFEKVVRLAAIESTVHGTPSESGWNTAMAAGTQAVEKLLTEQKDYPALMALKNKCTQPLLAGIFERACKEAEDKALAVWMEAQREADKNVQACNYAAAIETARPFAASPVPAVVDAAHREMERISALEKTKKEEQAQAAAASKTQDDRQRYELYSALLKSTETGDLNAARRLLSSWGSKPDSHGIAPEIALIGDEFKWIDDQNVKISAEMAEKKASIEVPMGKSKMRCAVTQATKDTVSISADGASTDMPVGKLFIEDILKYHGWSTPAKETAFDTAKYLFWRDQLKEARKRIESPSTDDERKLLERIDLILNGKDRFYKPEQPKLASAAVPKEMSVNGKAPEGAKDVPVDLAWELTPNARKYRVERKVGTGDFQALIETTDKKFRDEKQPLETQLSYRLVAINTAGESTPSDPILVKTPEPKIVNLLTGGDFENGRPNDWGPTDSTDKGNVVFSTDGPHSGKQALLLKNFATLERRIAVKDGKKYEVTGWVKLVPHNPDATDGSSDSQVRSTEYELLGGSPRFDLGNGRGRGDGERKKIPADEWTKFTYTFTARGDHVLFRFHKHHDESTDTMFDDVMLYEAP